MDKPLSVLVIGAGMYVGGRGAGTDGTILPTLIQAQDSGLIGNIVVAATTSQSVDTLKEKLLELNLRMGTSVTFKGYPDDRSTDIYAYRAAINALEKPACAIISVPDHLHYSITSDVIQAGIHSLVVKPLTPTLKEAVDLDNLRLMKDIHGAVEFHKRWDETNLLLRQAITDRCLGDLRYITVEYSQRRLMKDIFQSWLSETNIFQYLGVHYVDLVYFLTGATPIRALATGQLSIPQILGKTEYDSIQALIEWEMPDSGVRFTSSIVASWVDPNQTSAMSDQKITVVGNEGRYQIDQKNRGAQLVTQDGGIDEINPYFSQIYKGNDNVYKVNGYGPRSITQFLQDVKDIVAAKTTPQCLIGLRPSFKDCLVSTAVTEAVNLSLNKDNEWVYINELNGFESLA